LVCDQAAAAMNALVQSGSALDLNSESDRAMLWLATVVGTANRVILNG
jgi:hypothetical protein